MRPALAFVLILAGATAPGCAGDSGPEISIGLNNRNLCLQPVSGVDEVRCATAEDCNAVAGTFCWDHDADVDTAGYCRECDINNPTCPGGGTCDHGWCRSACTADGECAAGEFCTGGFCRPPVFITDFMFDNVGEKNLEIYPGRSELHGPDGACAFARVEWNDTSETIVLAPDQSALMRMYFTPEDVGDYRGMLLVFSNSESLNPLPLTMCARTVETMCDGDFDETCEECPMSCTAVDFDGMMEQTPSCD